MHALGLGLRLGPGEGTPEALRAAVARLLSEGGYRQRAVAVRAEVEARPGPAEVVRLLEEAPTR